MPKTIQERFDAKWTPEPNTGCWLWFGAATAAGYGSFAADGGRMQMAHRTAWEMRHGPIQDRLVIDHLCRNKSCVNPDHLEAVTMAENTRRGLLHSEEVKAARRATFHARVTSCPSGHLYSVHGRTNNRGTRYCRLCSMEGNRKAYRKRRGEVNGG